MLNILSQWLATIQPRTLEPLLLNYVISSHPLEVRLAEVAEPLGFVALSVYHIQCVR